LAGCGGASSPVVPTRRLEFVVLEDYDKGADLGEVARDFALIRELGATGWRGSFGWDDYEPAPGRYDFAWLVRFARLAHERGVRLRPYLGYTPEWASGGGGSDGQVWNDPPRRPTDFARFAARLAAALQPTGSVASYEIYNEENTRLWWDGTAAEYAGVYHEAAESLRAAIPEVAVLPGGLVWPDPEWLRSACERDGAVAAAAVHLYAETWTPDSVTLERAVRDLAGPEFLEVVDGPCRRAPVWANEIGFATTRGKTERDQAEWWVRAIAGLAADPRVALVGIYEIKDLAPGREVIGEPENYHLGITRADRTPKLAFYTVRRLLALFDRPFTVERAGVKVHAPMPAGPQPEVRLFRRDDGRQVLIAWLPRGGAAVTIDVALAAAARQAVGYALDGAGSPVPVHGRTIRDLRLAPGTPRMLLIEP
jgi:polysaccharide biosynthesis protein PslG